jgi:hypothetical protein
MEKYSLCFERVEKRHTDNGLPKCSEDEMNGREDELR